MTPLAMVHRAFAIGIVASTAIGIASGASISRSFLIAVAVHAIPFAVIEVICWRDRVSSPSTPTRTSSSITKRC